MVHEEAIPPLHGPGRFLELGPRYDNIQNIWASPGGTEKLVSIRLPEAFASDLDEHFLHPPLLDSATSLARNFSEPFHLPFVYSSLQLNEPLPASFFSHIRRRTSPDGLIVADIDIIAPDGKIIAAITGFTMRMINDAVFAADQNGDHQAAREPAAADSPSPRPAEPQAQVTRGLAPRNGAQLLLKLLQSRTPRQVAILPHREGRPVLLPGIPLEWVSGNQTMRTSVPAADSAPDAESAPGARQNTPANRC
jgi:hypothetical protein